MCLNNFKLQPMTPNISKKCLEVKFQGCFSQAKQLTIRNKKKVASSRGIYLLTHTKKIHKKIMEKKILPEN